MSKTKFLPIVGMVIFAFILSKIEFGQMYFYLKNINWYYFILALFLGVPLTLLKGYKWGRLLRIYEIRYSAINCAKAWLVGFFMGTVTPGRVGDFTRALYLKKDEDIPLGKALTSVIIDRLFDVGVVILLGAMGVLYFIYIYSQGISSLMLVLLIASLFVFLSYFMTKKSAVKRIFKPVFNVFIPEKYKQKIRLSFHSFYEGLEEIKNSKLELLTLFILTFISWLGSFFIFYLLGKSLGLDITYLYIIFVMAIEQLSEILPISFGGVGTREAVMIPLLGQVGVDASAVIGFSILILLNMYLTSLFGGIIFVKESSKLKI